MGPCAAYGCGHSNNAVHKRIYHTPDIYRISFPPYVLPYNISGYPCHGRFCLHRPWMDMLIGPHPSDSPCAFSAARNTENDGYIVYKHAFSYLPQALACGSYRQLLTSVAYHTSHISTGLLSGGA